jgi:hypothetical protein
MFRTLKSNSPFSAPRDDTARASCGNGAKANSYHFEQLPAPVLDHEGAPNEAVPDTKTKKESAKRKASEPE